MNSCRYKFVQDEATEAGVPGKYDVESEIECSKPADSIVVTAKVTGVTKCTLHISAQNLGTGVSVTNGTNLVTGKSDITADISLTNLKYGQTAGVGAGACLTADETANGKITGATTLSAELVPGPVSIFVG